MAAASLLGKVRKKVLLETRIDALTCGCYGLGATDCQEQLIAGLTDPGPAP
jgi:hypothetical protein